MKSTWRRSLPDFPWRFAGCPQLFQHVLVAQGVHCLPKSPMLEGHHLSHCREPDDWRDLPADIIAFDEIEAARRQDEKPAIDQPTVAARFFDERLHYVPLTFQGAITPRRTHSCHSRQLPMA